MMDLNGTKYLAMFLLGGVSLFLGFIPLKIGKHFVSDDKEWKRTLTSVLLCFGGGVLFATSMIHMLPEVRLKMFTVTSSFDWQILIQNRCCFVPFNVKLSWRFLKNEDDAKNIEIFATSIEKCNAWNSIENWMSRSPFSPPVLSIGWRKPRGIRIRNPDWQTICGDIHMLWVLPDLLHWRNRPFLCGFFRASSPQWNDSSSSIIQYSFASLWSRPYRNWQLFKSKK